VDVIVRRWQDWTGQKATRESDGMAFDSIPASKPIGHEVTIADIGDTTNTDAYRIGE
jgi:hypothetical protein